MKKTVLIVHNYYKIPGGEDTVVYNEKKMLEKYGHKVFLYKKYNDDLADLSLIKKFFFPINMIFNFSVYREIKRIIIEKKVDIVHVHNTLLMISPAVYYAALKCQVPVVQTIHNFRLMCPGATFYRDGHVCEDCIEKGIYCAIKHKCYRSSLVQTIACVVNTIFHRSTGILKKINYICLTEFNKNKLLQLRQINSSQIYIKPNFVNTKIVNFSLKRKSQFVFAGRLDKLKGIDLLIIEWEKLGERVPDLIVCGTGPLEEWCSDYIQKNKIKNIKLMGYVSNEKVLNIISESQALIFPTQWYEGFPMSIVEAFSVGTPVICSDIGNCGNIVMDGINGYKFKEFDEIENCLLLVENNIDIFRATFECYRKFYSEEENIKMIEYIYDHAKIL